MAALTQIENGLPDANVRFDAGEQEGLRGVRPAQSMARQKIPVFMRGGSVFSASTARIGATVGPSFSGACSV